MATRLKVAEPTFIKGKAHELSSTIKKLGREASKAVETLAKLMDSEDEKIAKEASIAVLSAYKDMVDQASKEEIQRLICDKKFGDGSRNLVIEDDSAVLDFENILPAN